MIIKRFNTASDRYDISTKLCLPETQPVKGIILGVHGFAGDKESSALQAVAEKSTRDGIALLCFDLPSHGASPVNEDQVTIANCLNDVLFMADYCRNAFPEVPRYCFATSFGGFLVLLAAPGLNDFKTVLRAPAVTMPQHIFLDLIHMTPEVFKEAGPVNCGFERPLVLDYRFYEDIRQVNVLDKVYTEDTLVIHGTADDVVPHSDILSFCADHPSMHLRKIEGADHRFKKPGELEQVVADAFDFWMNNRI